MEDLTVMVVDSSARAHAVADSYLRDLRVRRVIVTDDQQFVKFANKTKKEVVVAAASHKNPEAVAAVAQEHKPGLIDICQDDALEMGMVDKLRHLGFRVFGPSQAASRLEWDKQYSREFMHRHSIPHPDFAVCNSNEDNSWRVIDFYAKNPDRLMFVKASGLCAGKGAIPARNEKEALAAIEKMKSFGNAGETFLIEEGMVGEEASIYTACDVTGVFTTLRAAQDHKARDNYDLGPNTGGMGAIAPASVITNDLERSINETIIRPALQGMIAEGHPYVGILYTGVMITEDGPKVVEFNARWGAPEAEVVIPGIVTPMSKIADACIEGGLNDLEITQECSPRVCVVVASRGYPDSGEVAKVKGKQIFGLEDAMKVPGVRVYGAGVKVKDGKFYVNGGRIVSVVGESKDIFEARALAYHAASLIFVEGNNQQYRTDIGHRDVERMRKVA